MEQLFSSLAISGANLVGKAAFSYATGYAAKQISGLVHQQISQNANPRYNDLIEETKCLHRKLLNELAVINPAMDLCESISSRGNTYLKDVSRLGEEFKLEVESLGNSAEVLMNETQEYDLKNLSPKDFSARIKKTEEMKKQIEDILSMAQSLVPFLLLAMQTSGVNHNVYLSTETSPSQLLKASYAITEAANKFDLQRRFIPTPGPVLVSVGSPMLAKIYTLFTSHSRTKGYDDFTWKELIPKCQISVERAQAPKNLKKDYIYVLKMLQDLDDGLYHDEDLEKPACYSSTIDNVMQLYYSSSGSILKINTSNVPVLVIMLSREAVNTDSSNVAEEKILSKILDKGPELPKWYAVEIYKTNEAETSESGSDERSDDSRGTDGPGEEGTQKHNGDDLSIFRVDPKPNELTWLEYVIRLTSLEMRHQISHLSAKDEQLCFTLSNTAKKA